MAGDFDAAHYYLQWGGKLPGGDDWSCGLRLAYGSGGFSTISSANVDAICEKVHAFHQSTGAQIGSGALLSFAKLNPIDIHGHYQTDPSHEKVYADLPGGGGTQVYPNQVAIAVTLVTGLTRGPAHKGRFFLPLPTLGLGTDGLVSAANATTLSTAADGFISNINTVDTNWKVAVFSRKAGAPAHRLVTGCDVGRVLDTQRRRRRKLGEDYR